MIRVTKYAAMSVTTLVILTASILTITDKYRSIKIQKELMRNTAQSLTHGIYETYTICGTDEDIRNLFSRYNSQYFGGLLKSSVSFKKSDDDAGWYVPLGNEIFIDPKYRMMEPCDVEDIYGQTLIHEMAHAEVTRKFPAGDEKHGPHWKAEMRRLAGAGALDSSLWSKQDKP